MSLPIKSLSPTFLDYYILRIGINYLISKSKQLYLATLCLGGEAGFGYLTAETRRALRGLRQENHSACSAPPR